MSAKELTTFQKMNEIEKKLFVSRLVNLCIADEKAYKVMDHWMGMEEQRLKDNHIQIATNFPQLIIP